MLSFLAMDSLKTLRAENNQHLPELLWLVHAMVGTLTEKVKLVFSAVFETLRTFQNGLLLSACSNTRLARSSLLFDSKESNVDNSI